jgi:hypothetical protein
MAQAESDSTGAFVVCGIPMSARIVVQSAFGQDSSGVVELDVPANGLLRRDLWVGTAQRDTAALLTAADSAAADSAAGFAVSGGLLRGPGVLRGLVQSAQMVPVAGAIVRVRGSVASTATDASGVFTLGDVPTGTHALEVIAVGFQPYTVAVDVGTLTTAKALTIQLAPVDVTLDTQRVFADRKREVWREGFESRRKMGMGRFVDASAIDRRNPMLVADVLRMLPSLTIRDGQFLSQSTVLMRSTGGYCAPNFVIDGMRVPLNGMSIEMLVSAQELVAIEVYRSAILTPAEFGPSGPGGCGTIVFWRGVRESVR